MDIFSTRHELREHVSVQGHSLIMGIVFRSRRFEMPGWMGSDGLWVGAG